MVFLISTINVTYAQTNLAIIDDQMISVKETQEYFSTDYNDSVFISEQEAREIARLFIQDALSFGDVEWNENTYIKKIIEMYSSDDEKKISAYCIELDSGYIVVSAYYDTSSLIPEWSDQVPPLYSSFSSKQGEIIYLGLYNYYLDTGKKYVENLDGQHISRNDLQKENKIERSRKYIPESILNEMTSNADNSGSSFSSTISDPLIHAENNYTGPFICNDYVNEWEPYMSFYTTNYQQWHLEWNLVLLH